MTENYQHIQHKLWVFHFSYMMLCINHKCFWFSVILLKFCSKMPYSAGIMLAPKIAYSARNYASRIHPSLFCFPDTLSVPQGEAEGSRGSKTVLLPVGPIIKCFVIPPNSRKLFACKKNYFLEVGWHTFAAVSRCTTWSPASWKFKLLFPNKIKGTDCTIITGQNICRGHTITHNTCSK